MKALVLLLSLSSALSLLSVNGNVYETEDAIIVEAADIKTNGMYLFFIFIYFIFCRDRPMFIVD